MSPETLRTAGLSRSKVAYIPGIAEKAVAGFSNFRNRAPHFSRKLMRLWESTAYARPTLCFRLLGPDLPKKPAFGPPPAGNSLAFPPAPELVNTTFQTWGHVFGFSKNEPHGYLSLGCSPPPFHSPVISQSPKK